MPRFHAGLLEVTAVQLEARLDVGLLQQFAALWIATQ